jgi:flagellar hook-length control protein FliK
MRIQKTHTESPREIAQSKGEAGKSDRFSMILEERRKESMPQFNLLARGESPELSVATVQPGHFSGVPASTEVERLAAEIVDRIFSHQSDGSRSLDIQFNSQTLEGLRVNVRSSQGSIAVSFQTPVARVAGLVQKNLGSLRSALESKGVRVSRLVVSTLTG